MAIEKKEQKYTEDDILKAKELLAKVEAEQLEAERKAIEEAKAPKKFKAGKWVCVEDCYHNGTMYKAGDVAEWKKAGEAPVVDGFVKHFQPEA